MITALADLDIHLPDYEVLLPLTRAESVEATDWTYDFYQIDKFHKKGWFGEGEKIAILDTGLNNKHPDLKGTVFEAIDYTGEGLEDLNFHSTWCHGRVSAQHNSFGTKGIAPAAKIFIGKTLKNNGSGSMEWVAKSIIDAANMGVTIINMSLGAKNRSEAVKQACEYAYRKGVIICCAAGNDGKSNNIDHPAVEPTTIAVGSHDKLGVKSSYSDTGKQLDILDAGDNVISTYGEDGYAWLRGTSMSTPTLVGKLACMRQPIISKYGEFTYATIKQAITCRSL